MPLGSLSWMRELPALVLGQTVDPAATPTEETGRSILQYIQSGGLLSYVLIGLSIVGVALMIMNLIALRRQYLMPDGVVDDLEQLFRERNVEAVQAFVRKPENDCFLSRVIGAGLDSALRSQFGMFQLNASLEDAASRELEKIDRPTHGLALLAAIGPMLGLLGTVIGMIGAFGAISKFEGAARSSQLSDFMSLALVNTAEGLILAIPCTITYSLFRRRTDRLMREVAEVAERLTSSLQGAGASAVRPAVPAAGAGVRPAARPAPTSA